MGWKQLGGGFIYPANEFSAFGGFSAPDEFFRFDFASSGWPLTKAEGWMWVRVVHALIFGEPGEFTASRHYSSWYRVYPLDTGYQELRIAYPPEFLTAYSSSQYLEAIFGNRFRIGSQPYTDWQARAWVFEGSGPTATQGLIADGGVY